MAASISLAACGMNRSAFQVEQLEDTVAEVVDLDSGRATTVPRRMLPPKVKEGDVVVDGRIDRQLTAALRRQVEELHQRYAVPVPDGFSLEDSLIESPKTPLTIGEE
jgi:hypothetical protein